MAATRDIAAIEVEGSERWALAAASALLERSILARRLHNGPLQDIAATMIDLQLLADRTDARGQLGLNDAIAILVEQQRIIRAMVEDMLSAEIGAKVAIAPVLDGLAMRWRQTGRRLTWSVTPGDATCAADEDLRFRLNLLEALSPIRSSVVNVDVHVGQTIDVMISAAGKKLAEYSLELAT